MVIADDPELKWPQEVLSAVQGFALERGYFTQKMVPQMHTYHLDDAPELRSCNLLLKALPGNASKGASEAITDPGRLRNFYGRDNPPKVKYVRERKRLDYGNALEEEYEFDLMEETR